MEGRSFQNEDYLFAFQGQETNEELGTVHYKYREASIITGRFWSVDPLTAEYPHNSPFAFSENRVIDGIELEGLEFFNIKEKEDINEEIFSNSGYDQVQVAQNTVATFVDLLYSIKNVIYMTSGIPIRDRKQADGSRKVETVFTETWSESGKNILRDLGDVMNVLSLGGKNPAALLVKTGGKGNTAKKAADAAADAINTSKGLETTRLSVIDKLDRYLLNLEHPIGGSKAKWFEKALGFTKENMNNLAKQIVFDETKATQTALTEYGAKFNQLIKVEGANGKIIEVNFAWMKNKEDGFVRLVTAIPTSKK